MWRVLTLVAVMLAGLPTVCAASPPLPSDLVIVPPTSDVPPDTAKFSGKWAGGKWDGKLENILVVETIVPSGDAMVVYAWEDYKPWKLTRRWIRVRGKIAEGKLKATFWKWQNQRKVEATVEYWLNPDGSLSGRYERSGRSSSITLYRQ